MYTKTDTFTLWRKDWTKQKLRDEINRLHRKDMNEELKFSTCLSNVFEDLLETMDADGIAPQDVWACRDWWQTNVKSRSLTLHTAIKKEMQDDRAWRFRTPPLFIVTDEEMEEAYYPRGKKRILKFDFKTADFEMILEDKEW